MSDAAAAKLAPQATIYSNQNQNQSSSSSSSSSSYNASEGAGAGGADGAGMQVDAAAIEGAGMYKS